MKTTELLADLIESRHRPELIDLLDMRVYIFPSGLLNISAREGDLTDAQLTAFRAELARAGYREIQCQRVAIGPSWRSADVPASVTMRVTK